MSNKYAVEFRDSETGEEKLIVVELNNEEMESVRAMTERRDLFASAYALTHAYRQARLAGDVAKGFRHVNGSVRAVH